MKGSVSTSRTSTKGCAWRAGSDFIGREGREEREDPVFAFVRNFRLVREEEAQVIPVQRRSLWPLEGTIREEASSLQ